MTEVKIFTPFLKRRSSEKSTKNQIIIGLDIQENEKLDEIYYYKIRLYQSLYIENQYNIILFRRL